MKFIKKNKKYFFLFIIFFLSLWIFGFYNHRYDSFWNYSFSYGIVNGQIPYRDFNMVSTPFTAFFFSIFLLISTNYIFYLIGWSLVLTITFYFLFQLLQQKAWLVFLLLLFPFLHTIIPTYNLFFFCLFTFLLYLEKFQKQDYFIGFIVGLLILTKHTIGIFFLLPSLFYYRKDFKKIGKRVLGCLLPCFIFFIYLFCTNSFSNFMDLCIFGLFDFSGNRQGLSIYFYLSILLLLFSLGYLKKKQDRLLTYYILCTFSFVLPLFDGYHFSLFACSVLILILLHWKKTFRFSMIVVPVSIVLCIGNFFIHQGTDSKFLSFLPNLKFYRASFSQYQMLDEMNTVFKKYYERERPPILLSTQSAFIYSGNYLDLNYFLVFLKGNYGYNGSKKLCDRVETLPRIFIINRVEMEEIQDNGEYLYQVSQYVIEHFQLISVDGDYLIYRKES